MARWRIGRLRGWEIRPSTWWREPYLKEGFINLCEKHAVSKIHPDISTSGGILETHKMRERAMELGVPMAMHYAGTPVGAMASVHCAAATANFLACGASDQQGVDQGSGQAGPGHHLER
jgi:L-alanine-DL-glutamate epimerase-like enolase superfamily enzyme